MTIEIQVADLITATTALTTAVNVQKTTLDTAVTNASTSAATASSASTQASSSATNASSSATAASGSAATAATQATNASTSFTNAANSATAASTSATTATAQATTAATQATNAGNSATASAASAATATGQASTAAAQATNANTSAVTAASSQTAAATSATAAANSQTASNGSASAALTSQTAASTSASAALTSQNAASTSAGAASTSQTAAATSAGAASTSQSAAATSATAAANSATASALSAANASTSQNSATASATLSTTNANTATTQNTASGTSASASAASATASASARDLSIAAWAASTAPAETLAAMSQSLHVGTVVKAIIYDTSKDSDPAWRKRCTDKSWFTETLGGSAWLATKCPDEATARAAIQSAKSPELVTNGTFDSGVTGWTLTGGASVSNGVVNIAGISNCKQTLTTVSGKSYAIQFSALKAADTLQVWANGSMLWNSFSGGTGQRNFSFVASGATALIEITGGDASASGSIDNISVKVADTTVSAAGYVYQTTATGSKYFSLTGTSGQTEIFRGIVSEFPAKVAIVAESARVVIYDLSTGAMWRVFRHPGSSSYLIVDGYAFRATSVAAVNGQVFVSLFQTDSAEPGVYGGVVVFEFINDSIMKYRGASTVSGVGRVAPLTAGLGTSYQFFRGTGPQYVCVHGWVNDVAVTILDNAPIDPATGLPVPTVAVATAGGVSVIKQDGTVVNSASTASSPSVNFTGTTLSASITSNVFKYASVGSLTAGFNPSGIMGASSFYSSTQIPITLVSSTQATESSGGNAGLIRSKTNTKLAGLGMVAAITNAYNSGWQLGDSRFCGLADVVAETITAPEMVVNGTFDDATNLTLTGATVSGGTLNFAASSSDAASFVGASLIAGKSYKAVFTVTASTASFGVRILSGGAIVQDVYYSSVGTYAVTFTAPITDVLRFARASTAHSGTVSIDNVSCKLADPDRSVKNNALSIVGSLVKTAVATGAQLVAYSGFSAANYLEQPYSANLDFGTGEWNAGVWMTTSASPATVAAAIAAGGGLGAELVTNGGFDSATGWTVGAGWSITGGSASFSTNTADSLRDSSTTYTPGKTYRVTFDKVGTGLISLYLRSSAVFQSTGGTGFYSYVVVAGSGTYGGIELYGATGAAVDNLSVREVTGILPLFERTRLRNLQPFSNDINNAGWNAINVTKSTGALTRSSTTAAYIGTPAFATPLAAGTKFTTAALVKAKSLGGRFGLRPTGTYPDRVDAVFDIVAGTVVGVVNGGAFSVGTASISGPDANGFYLCAATGTVGGTSLVNLVLGPTDSSLTTGGWEGASTVLSDCFISGAAIFIGTLTAAQILARGGIPMTTGTISATVPSLSLGLEASGKLVGTVSDGTTVRMVTSSSVMALSTPTLVGLSYRTNGSLELTLNDAVVATTTGTALLTLNNSTAVLIVGNGVTSTLPFPGSLSLLAVSATVPSSDQASQIYRDELALFQPNAQCTLAGTSTAVTALTYDESTDLLHVGTSWGRSEFKGLLRTASEATTTGSITSLSAYQGVVVTGGTSAKIYQPALQLRDELGRKEEARKALGKVPVFIDFTATASQTAFVLAKGYTAKGLYRNGTLMRETTTGVFWTRSFDGYQETATLSVAATSGDWVSLMCVRSN